MRARRSCWRSTSGRRRRRRRARRSRWARGNCETGRAADCGPYLHYETETAADANGREHPDTKDMASPEIRAIYWDIGGVLLSNGWDHEERARVLAQFAIPRDEYESRHEEA